MNMNDWIVSITLPESRHGKLIEKDNATEQRMVFVQSFKSHYLDILLTCWKFFYCYVDMKKGLNDRKRVRSRCSTSAAGTVCVISMAWASAFAGTCWKGILLRTDKEKPHKFCLFGCWSMYGIGSVVLEVAAAILRNLIKFKLFCAWNCRWGRGYSLQKTLRGRAANVGSKISLLVYQWLPFYAKFGKWMDWFPKFPKF